MSYYRVHLTVGDRSWVVEEGDAPDYGPTDDLRIGWEFPENQPRPQQPDPVEAKFGIVVESPADLAGVDIGTPVSIAVFTDPLDYDPPAPFETPPALALFAGRVTEIDAQPHRLGLIYTFAAADYLVDLIAPQAKDLGGGPTTIAQQNQPGSLNNYQLPPIRNYIDDLFAQADLPSPWLYSSVPPDPDDDWGLHTLGLGMQSLRDLIVGVLRSYLLLTPGTDGERGIVLPGVQWDTDTWTADLNPDQPFYVDFYGKRMQTAAPGRVPPGQWDQLDGGGEEPEPDPFVPVPFASGGWRYLVAPDSDSVDRSAAAFDDSSWTVGNAPFVGPGLAPDHVSLGWPGPGVTLDSANRVIWLRRTIAAAPGATSVFITVRVDGGVRVYWNGTLIADPGESWSISNYRSVAVPAASVLASNVLAVRVVDDFADPGGDYIYADVEATATSGVTPADYDGLISSTFGAAVLAHYKLDEANGATVANDSSGNARHGAYVGSPAHASAPSLIAGSTSPSAGLGLGSDAVNVADAAWMDVPELTIMTLVSPTTTTSGQRDIAARAVASGTPAWQLQQGITGRIQVFTHGAGNQLVFDPAGRAALSVLHVAFTFTPTTPGTFGAGTVRLYVNGALVASGPGTLPANSDQALRIGSDSNGGQHFDGRVGRFTYLNRAATPAQIATLAAAALQGDVAEPEPVPTGDPWTIVVDPDVADLPDDLADLWPYPVTAAESGVIDAATVELGTVKWNRNKSQAVDVTEIGWSTVGDGAGNGGAERVYRFANTPRPVPVVRSLGQVHAYNGSPNGYGGQVAFLGRYYTPDSDTAAPKFQADRFVIWPAAGGADPHRLSAGGWRNLLRPDSALGNPLIVIAGIRDGWNPNPGAPDYYAGVLRGAQLTIQRGDYSVEIKVDQDIPRAVRSTGAADGYMSYAAQRGHPTYSQIDYDDVATDVTYAHARLLRRP